MHVSLCFFVYLSLQASTLLVWLLVWRSELTRYTCTCRFVFRLLAFEYASPLHVWHLERGIHAHVVLFFVCLSLQASPLLVWHSERGIHTRVELLFVCLRLNIRLMIDPLTLRTRYTCINSFVIPLFILISVSITRLTLRTRYTCMSFGCHFPPFASC